MRNLKLSSFTFFTVIIFIFQFSACGSGGGGGGSSATTETSAEEKIVGNFFFQYTIISTFDSKVTIDTKTDRTNSDGVPIYSGFNAEAPSLNLIAVGAWWPSLGAYIIVQETALSGFQEGFSFVIEGDNRLTGKFNKIINGEVSSLTFELDSSVSKKFELGAWARSLLRSGDIYSEAIQRLGEATMDGSQAHRTSIDNATMNALAELSGYLNNN